MIHLFDVEHALKYGVNESIMISNFQFWIHKNRSNGTNFHDGKTWTYNSVNAFKEIFPYWNIGQIRRCLESLVVQEILVKGDYNKNRYQRTLWYAFCDESIFLNQQIHLSKTANGDDENDKCITDTKPNDKPNKGDFDFSGYGQLEPLVKKWLDYKKSIKQGYKSQQSLNSFFKKLKDLSGDNILIADSIIEQSIAFEYKGIFTLKNKKEASTDVPAENASYKPPHQKGVDFSNCIPKSRQ